MRALTLASEGCYLGHSENYGVISMGLERSTEGGGRGANLRLKFAHFPYLDAELNEICGSSSGPVRILDVGCGPGALGGHCGKRPGAEWFGGDLWEHQLAQAKEKGTYRGLFQCHLLDGLPLKAQSVDVVVAGEVLMYLPNSRKLLEEIHRVLVPGGTAYVYNPISWAPRLMRGLKELVRLVHLESDAIAFNRKDDWRDAQRPARVTYYSFDGLKAEISSVGLNSIETRGFRIFRNRIRALTRLEKRGWYLKLNRRLLDWLPSLASDLMVKARKGDVEQAASGPEV